MKKTIAALMITASLFTQTPETQAKTVNPCLITGKTYTSQALHQPAVLQQLKKGTYAARGIKLNQSYKYVISKLGKPKSFEMEKRKEGTAVYADYDEYVISFYFPKRSAKLEDTRVVGVTMLIDGKKRILQSDIEKTLGKPDNSTPVENETKTESFGYLHADYTEIANGWLAETITMANPKYLDLINAYYDEGDAYLTAKPATPLTDKALLSMKKGTYTYKGVKLNEGEASVNKKLPTSNYDEYTAEFLGEDSYQSLDKYYGANDWINLTFDAPRCDSKYNLTSMTFYYHGYNLPEAKIRSLLGKPEDSFSDNYENDFTGVMEYTKTLSYNNLEVELTKKGKTYFVDYVTYQ